jgi:hypothetical protein
MRHDPSEVKADRPPEGAQRHLAAHDQSEITVKRPAQGAEPHLGTIIPFVRMIMGIRRLPETCCVYLVMNGRAVPGSLRRMLVAHGSRPAA